MSSPGLALRRPGRQRLCWDDGNRGIREAGWQAGFILLALIGGLFRFGFTRVRRRMGLGVTWRTWWITFLVRS